MNKKQQKTLTLMKTATMFMYTVEYYQKDSLKKFIIKIFKLRKYFFEGIT